MNPDLHSDAVFDGDDVRFHLKRWWNPPFPMCICERKNNNYTADNPYCKYPHSAAQLESLVKAKRWAVWLMTNPSFADKDREDQTTRRLNVFTERWGYGGWIAVNIYPFVTPHIRKAWARANWIDNGPDYHARDCLQINLAYIREAARVASIRIVAFGSEIARHNEPWVEQCIEAFSEPSELAADERLYCIGTSAAGQPIHPMARGRLRVPDHVRPRLWKRP